MGGSNLVPDQVTPDLASDHENGTAAWIIGRHPEWAGALAVIFKRRLAEDDLSLFSGSRLSGQLAHFAHEKPVQDLMAETLLDKSAPIDARRTVLQAVTHSGLKDVPQSWVDGLTASLSVPELVLDVRFAAARRCRIARDQAKQFTPALLRLEGGNGANRLSLYSAVPGGLPVVTPDQFAFLRKSLGPESDFEPAHRPRTSSPARRSTPINL